MGTITFNDDKTLTYGTGGARPDSFQKFELLTSNVDATWPMIVILGAKDGNLGGKDDGVWYHPYHRDNDILLVAINDKNYWIELTRD
ncbi:hypothetical protein [Rubrimonas cliftonensis]|uniref:Uncharacterized protein n=1 Tax=Rubrimonas cliftonensis TaxID=89524 RepID=A0A1H4DRH8_9RHOB|nr:hypothetical protein [Rubrimonas cliftonensis]SEA75385.1 hypothetical protein SAMN05444370_1111 [Rubrimonas cliftonensis]